MVGTGLAGEVGPNPWKESLRHIAYLPGRQQVLMRSL